MLDLVRIENFLRDFLKDSPHFLVEVDLKKGDHLEVYIDSYQKFSHDDCIRVTRALQQEFGALLDTYHLTVSSAGLDRPFRTEQQYHKNIGREVKVVMLDGRSLSGFLEAVLENGIRLKPRISAAQGKKEVIRELEPIDIPFSEIKSTTRIIKF
jgi:ribosome maturation factor RimP